MNLYEKWIQNAYTKDGTMDAKFWKKYSPKEEHIYKTILENKLTVISGTVAEFAGTHDLPVEWAVGYLDGISGALTDELDANELEADTEINIHIDFEKLYKKMVEFKAEYLYTLPEWENIYSEEERKKLYTEQKRSTTIVKDSKVGRNEPCPCGSGKKYKKCCGA